MLSGLFPGTADFHALGFHPLGAMLFTGAALLTALRGPMSPSADRARPEENVSSLAA